MAALREVVVTHGADWDLVDEPDVLAAFWRGELLALHRAFVRLAPAVDASVRRGFVIEQAGTLSAFTGFASALEQEEVRHRVFARAFAANERWAFDGHRRYGPHLQAIVRAVVAETLRASAQEPPVAVLRTVTTPGLRALPLALDADDPDVAALTAALPPRERQVFALRFVEQREVIEACARTGLTPAAIGRSEARIRVAVAERWGGRAAMASVGCGGRARLIGELAGTLPMPERVALRHHARQCGACRTSWDRLAAVEAQWLAPIALERPWAVLAAELAPAPSPRGLRRLLRRLRS